MPIIIKIGSAPTNDIVLNSPQVSASHAELYLLDCGSIFLKDRGSHNGTFVQNIATGQPAPVGGSAVKVNRGDAILFGNTYLDWSRVPQITYNPNNKAIYTIGSHQANDIQVSGATVSQFHATVKVTKDGKVYIEDHSLNGTTVDGQRISANNPYRLKRKNAVVCGGVPVNLDFLFPKSVWGTVAKVAACVLILAGAGFGLYKALEGGEPSLHALQKATARVYGQYYLEVTFDDDPFVRKVKGWPEKWVFGIPKDATKYELTLGTLTGQDIKPITYTGTAFFISENGELGTNRHIARPWEYISDDEQEAIRQQMAKFFDARDEFLLENVLYPSILDGSFSLADAKAYLKRLQTSSYKVSGSFDYLGIALAGTNVTAITDLHACQVIAESGDEDKDVALLRLNSKETPAKIVKDGFFNIDHARVDERTLEPQNEQLTSIGYPGVIGISLDIIGKGTELTPTVHRTYISKTPDDDRFQMQGNVIGGQSGSPIIDSKRRLVGVMEASIRTTDVSYACNIKHLKELYDKYKVRRN